MGLRKYRWECIIDYHCQCPGNVEEKQELVDIHDLLDSAVPEFQQQS